MGIVPVASPLLLVASELVTNESRPTQPEQRQQPEQPASYDWQQWIPQERKQVGETSKTTQQHQSYDWQKWTQGQQHGGFDWSKWAEGSQDHANVSIQQDNVSSWINFVPAQYRKTVNTSVEEEKQQE